MGNLAQIIDTVVINPLIYIKSKTKTLHRSIYRAYAKFSTINIRRFIKSVTNSRNRGTPNLPIYYNRHDKSSGEGYLCLNENIGSV